MKRYLLVAGGDEQRIAAYLPTNYRVVQTVTHDGRRHVLVEGRDQAGWTLNGYVIPRLGSGLLFAQEIDLSHPTMSQVPA